jgi:hypothetical protein
VSHKVETPPIPPIRLNPYIHNQKALNAETEYISCMDRCVASKSSADWGPLNFQNTQMTAQNWPLRCGSFTPLYTNRYLDVKYPNFKHVLLLESTPVCKNYATWCLLLRLLNYSCSSSVSPYTCTKTIITVFLSYRSVRPWIRKMRLQKHFRSVFSSGILA